MASSSTPARNPRVTAGFEPPYIELVQGYVIRLLEVLPAHPDAPIVTRLWIHDLGHAPDYEAISYTWGSSTRDVTIKCNGKDFAVTRNLALVLKSVRLLEKSRLVWADAICINQESNAEKNHHVEFMRLVYECASSVLVCLGQDANLDANFVAELVEEHQQRAAKYASLRDMPLLGDDDPILDDRRWKALKSLLEHPWFSRTWVLQEVGVARNPQILYGAARISYRGLMKLKRWIVRCAAQLQTGQNLSLLTIHTDWEDWTDDWKAKQDYEYSAVDLLSAAKGLGCTDPRDRVYALLGHPLLQNANGSGPIILPKYEKHVDEIYREFTAVLLKTYGLKVLSAVEHDEETIIGDVPSWTARWDMDIIQNSMGYYSGFYYRASGNEKESYAAVKLPDHLSIQAIFVRTIHTVHAFSPHEKDWEVEVASKALHPTGKLNNTLSKIVKDVKDAETPCIYEYHREEALSLTLCAGLMNYESAEQNLDQHRKNAEAFQAIFEQAIYSKDIHGTNAPADSYYYDLSLSCKGRALFITDDGYFGLGPMITQPGDECYVIKGARVPFVLRKAAEEGTWKLLGEAYIHGLMNGEFVNGKTVDWKDLTIV